MVNFDLTNYFSYVIGFIFSQKSKKDFVYFVIETCNENPKRLS